jgi:hypothetical protein
MDIEEKLKKEIANLKKENKKLRAALDKEGIEPDSEVLGKKLGAILTGKELRIAAEKGLKVRYICKFFDANDKKYKNSNEDCIMEKTNNWTDEEHWYYIGDGDICLEDYADTDLVISDFGEGTFEVRRTKGVKYI